jgi:hypothetical protein
VQRGPPRGKKDGDPGALMIPALLYRAVG